MAHGDLWEDWKAGNSGGLEAEGEPISIGSGSTTPSVRALKTEVAILELEKKKKSLLRELGDGQPQHYPDMAERIGAGPMVEPVRAEVQARAFGTNPQPQSKQPSLMDLLNSPNLALILAGVKGALGVGQSGGGLEGVSALLGLIGAKDLRSLIGSNATVATAPADFEFAGQKFPAGFPLDPGLIKLAIQGEKGDPLANALERTLAQFGKWVEEGKIGGGGPAIANKLDQPGVIVCSQCGTETQIPVGTMPGDKIECSNPDCEVTFTAEDGTVPEPQPKAPKRQAKVKKEAELPRQINCPDCGQLISIEGMALGQTVNCPICQKELTLSSEDIAIPPEPVKKKDDGSLYERKQRL